MLVLPEQGLLEINLLEINLPMLVLPEQGQQVQGLAVRDLPSAVLPEENLARTNQGPPLPAQAEEGLLRALGRGTSLPPSASAPRWIRSPLFPNRCPWGQGKSR